MDCVPWRLRLCLCLWLCIHFVLLSWSGSSAITRGNDTERLALLAFKGGITQDPRGILSSWNDSFHFCKWIGVICSPSDQRVVMLSLESQELVGSISPSVEYGMGGEVSVLGDVYSYGVLLLETFTGRRPTDAMFEGYSLYDFVLKAFPDRILDIADPFLISKEQEHEDSINNCETLLVLDKDKGHSSNMERTEECLVSVIRVGLSCCAPSPKERMHMRDVVTKMNAIRDSLIGSLGKSKRNLLS